MTHEIECLACHKTIEIEGESLPDNACDDAEIICDECGATLTVGWRAEVEIRGFRRGATHESA